MREKGKIGKKEDKEKIRKKWEEKEKIRKNKCKVGRKIENKWKIGKERKNKKETGRDNKNVLVIFVTLQVIMTLKMSPIHHRITSSQAFLFIMFPIYLAILSPPSLIFPYPSENPISTVISQ